MEKFFYIIFENLKFSYMEISYFFKIVKNTFSNKIIILDVLCMKLKNF